MTPSQRDEERKRLAAVRDELIRFLDERDVRLTGGYDGSTYSEAYLMSTRDDLVSVEIDID